MAVGEAFGATTKYTKYTNETVIKETLTRLRVAPARQGTLSSATGFHTCSITELGFVRVAAVTGLQPDIKGARQALDALKSSSRIRFELIPDDLGAAHLPALVKTPQAVTDGHLVELARKNSLCFVTLDRGIPGSLFIG